MRRLGRVLFASGLTGIALLTLGFQDFALDWQPVPDGAPFRAFLAVFSGAILLAGGVGMLFQRTAKWASLVLALSVTVWLCLLQVPRVFLHPATIFLWLGFGENMILVAGGWILYAQATRGQTDHKHTGVANDRLIRWSILAYAALLPVIGLAHFVYVEPTASMVPAWLPYRHGWAYLTGAGHIAAGAGILLSVAPRLAAVMETVMLGCFLLLLHLPGVLAETTSRMQWTMLCIVIAYTGAAAVVAGALRAEGEWSAFWKLGSHPTGTGRGPLPG